MVQPGKAQPWSRVVTALRRWGGKKRLARPMSRICPWPPRTAGMMSASQARVRRTAAGTGPVKVKDPLPGAVFPGSAVFSFSAPRSVSAPRRCW